MNADLEHSARPGPASSLPHSWLVGVGFLLLAVVSLAPLLAERLPVTFASAHASPALDWGSKTAVLLCMALTIGVRAWCDRRSEPWSVGHAGAFTLLAGLLTAWHWYAVDLAHEDWQRTLYRDILNHQPEAGGQLRAPHQFRALPYGFTRSVEVLTGDWVFACLAYRWFFTYWFLWGCHRFARLFHEPLGALAVLIPVLALYPLAVRYYWGQLTDPLSHALFVLALIYVMQNRWLPLAASLALGILAKETAVVIVPGYWACYWRRGWCALWKTAALGAVCVVAFLAARLPLGWGVGYGAINGTEGLMIGTNLGIGKELYIGAAPTYDNYLHPLLFVGLFLPFIAFNWKAIDSRLKALFLIVVPLVLLSSLCFSWMYESRNYLALLPLLASMALPASVCSRG